MDVRVTRKRRFFVGMSISLLMALCLCGHSLAQSGHVLDGVGPVDQSMGGATTALPLDAIGVLRRNPASITGLRCSEIGLGIGVFAPASELSSKVNAGAFGDFGPPVTLSGSTSTDTDFSPMPSMGFVQKYIDYEGTDGFGPPTFDSTHAVTGFGWNSIWVAALGVQYHVNQCLQLRMGYTFNENAVSDDVSFFNVASCAIVQHHLNAGFPYVTPHDWVFAFAYHHGFENSISGPFNIENPDPAVSIPIPIPGTAIQSNLQTHTMVGSIAKRF